jgi:hypothetical protein
MINAAIAAVAVARVGTAHNSFIDFSIPAGRLLWGNGAHRAIGAPFAPPVGLFLFLTFSLPPLLLDLSYFTLITHTTLKSSS